MLSSNFNLFLLNININIISIKTLTNIFLKYGLRIINPIYLKIMINIIMKNKKYTALN